MVKIKGSAIQETINQIKSRSGDDALNKILDLLDQNARKVFHGEIFSSTWNPLDDFPHFLEVEIKVLANENEEMVTRGSEAVIERQLRGIYKAFVKLGSPEFVILGELPPCMPRTSMACLSKWTCPRPAPPLSDTKDFRSSTALWVFHHRFFQKSSGDFRRKNVDTHFTVPIDEGKEFAELAITWS